MRQRPSRRPVNWFLLGLLLLPLSAVGAYVWANGVMDSVEAYRSPLADSAPAPGEALGNPLTRRLVIVLIDALRYDTSTDAALMPTLNRLRAEGASAVMHSRPPSFSAPGWTTLLTGAWPDLNDSQPMNPPDEFSVRAFTQDNLFAAADRAGLRTAVSGYTWFEGMLAASGVDTGFYTLGEDDAADRDVVAAALPWLTDDYQLILIHLDQVDYAGHHQGGPRSPNWAAAASRSDALLAQIAAALDLEQDTLVIVSDHGQIDQGGHGGAEAVTLVEPFVMTGAGVRPGEYADVQMVDVAPTLAVLLGTNLPASGQGRPLLEMLNVTPERAAEILTAVRTQQAALLEAYAAAIGQRPYPPQGEAAVESTQLALEQTRLARLGQERVWRNVVAVFLAVLPGYLLFLRREKKARWLLAGALVYLAVFLGRYLLLDGNTFGLSWIPGLIEFIAYAAVTTGIALLAGWLTAMFGLRAWHGTARQAAGSALGYVWFVLYLLALPILLSFAVNGVTVTWTLPEFTVLYLGFLSVVQWLFAAAFGLTLVGVSAAAVKIIEARRS
ncbi:MAG: alkaline phosphatase family protein [Anaerolineales bacterium]